MTDLRADGLRVVQEMLPGATLESEAGFAPDLIDIGIENVFGQLWAREGLSRRDRSLVTLGILITLRASDELKAHFQIARTNGLTDEELAEVVYHASGYAGFPAAVAARSMAVQAFEAD